MKLMMVMTSILIVAVLGACDMNHTRCEDAELRRERSPDGKYTAITYHRACANNSAQYTWVNLMQENEGPLSKSETKPVLSLRGSYDIAAVWIDSQTIEITSAGLADQKAVLTQEDSWKTVHLRYKPR